MSTFFESLKRQRRLRLLEEINQALRQPHSQHLPDQRLADPRLEAFDFSAGDGHWHAAAVHHPVQEGTKFATGHLFGLDLRTHRAFHLQRCTQHSVKFIRWIRAHPVVPTSCTQALAPLATLYAKP